MNNHLTSSRRAELLAVYRGGLENDVLPFWLRHGMDKEHGGILTALGRAGDVIDTDKSVWFQGRAAWMFATASLTAGRDRDELAAAAVSCCEFLRRHAYAPDGKMYFTLTRDGRPLRMRRYVYSESFAAIGYAATHRIAGTPEYRTLALRAFETYLRHSFEPGVMPPKTEPTRPTRGIGPLMIGIVTAQELREHLGDLVVSGKSFTAHIAAMIDDIRRFFVKPELKAVLECVGENGEILDHFDGRLLNPGHAIEAAWFILREARRTDDAGLRRLGLEMLDWMWERGRDPVHGGLFYFTDLYGKPVQEYWHFMKFWWPHNEAIIATLLAYVMTGDEKYAAMHREIHDWSFAHFADPEHGEWFGYLDRAGQPTTELKGNMWKGPFHLPRMMWYCARLLEEN